MSIVIAIVAMLIDVIGSGIKCIKCDSSNYKYPAVSSLFPVVDMLLTSIGSARGLQGCHCLCRVCRREGVPDSRGSPAGRVLLLVYRYIADFVPRMLAGIALQLMPYRLSIPIALYWH